MRGKDGMDHASAILETVAQGRTVVRREVDVTATSGDVELDLEGGVVVAVAIAGRDRLGDADPFDVDHDVAVPAASRKADGSREDEHECAEKVQNGLDHGSLLGCWSVEELGCEKALHGHNTIILYKSQTTFVQEPRYREAKDHS